MIDFHMHLYPSQSIGRERKAGYEIWEYGPSTGVSSSSDAGMPEEAIAALDRGRLDYGVIANLFEAGPERVEADANGDAERSLADLLEASNRWVTDLAAAHSRLIAFVAVDPVAMGPAETTRHLESLRHQGARGVKIHPVLQGLDPQDEAWWPVFGACSELGLIVLAHSGPARSGGTSATPDAFVRLVEHLPGLRLVLAHLGGGAWRTTADAAARMPDVWFDCCEILERTGSQHGPTDRELAALVRQVGVDRVLFGSDYPWYEPSHGLEILRRLPGLSVDQVAMIAGGNAARLLGIDLEGTDVARA